MIDDDNVFLSDCTGAYNADTITVMQGSGFILTLSVASDPMYFVLVEKFPGEDLSQIKISLYQQDEQMFDND